jgi:hypothetical protein
MVRGFLAQRRKDAKRQRVSFVFASLRLGDFALKDLLYPWFNPFGCGSTAL